MTQQHTPGPWEAESFADGWNVWPISRKKPDGGAVAYDCTEPDARLIAAAPELLAALQMGYADTMDYIRLNNLGGENNHWLVQARAAIAKATGAQA